MRIKLSFLFLSLLLTACASNPPVPVALGVDGKACTGDGTPAALDPCSPARVQVGAYPQRAGADRRQVFGLAGWKLSYWPLLPSSRCEPVH